MVGGFNRGHEGIKFGGEGNFVVCEASRHLGCMNG